MVKANDKLANSETQGKIVNKPSLRRGDGWQNLSIPKEVELPEGGTATYQHTLLNLVCNVQQTSAGPVLVAGPSHRTAMKSTPGKADIRAFSSEDLVCGTPIEVVSGFVAVKPNEKEAHPSLEDGGLYLVTLTFNGLNRGKTYVCKWSEAESIIRASKPKKKLKDS